ncbi:hypothetical protein LIER_21345 [Lithospermum erythrorhizon]|uniref:Uncharacterized protein n=1 Tax=Lithospermum erythrorhizon TaxID=34254 RepID=A0AAV3QPV5_LITER
MEEALWAYRTTYRTPTQPTPYSLVYGVEAVHPLEVRIPSLRVAVNEGLTNEEDVHLRLQELDFLDDQRLNAQQSLECYQSRITKSYNKKVRQQSYQVEDMVLWLIHGSRSTRTQSGIINGHYLNCYYP